MLFFTEADVRRLLPMPVAIAQMRRVFRDLASGSAQNQPRRRLVLPTGSVLHSMAGAFGRYFGIKVYSTNLRYGAHFLFLLYSAEDAAPLALFEANYLGQIRTGAATGYATDLLARADADTLAVIGSGFQARTQVEAVLSVRPVRDVRVWSRKQENRERFAEECARELGAPVRPAASAEEAVRGAGIVVTATNSRNPVFEDHWIDPGTHINAIGSNQANRRETPPELVRRADLIAVDSIEQAQMEAGDLLLALDQADWQRVKELKDLSGRPSTRSITLFKSVGLGVEDVAAAAYVYESAGEGTRQLPVFHS
ncbi:MAG TPA: ornithine cyclodeaminase family protein [Bryobacteraceae bacterium]|nr:ornithine cyclodeaminase family protein [Bryobacteraceae bacterium]HOL72246.1 ornithine cyclodeaminase family protein [Bryobacteraceae bacterium]HOQ45615.1 ornithine cyclodeaminase family protein [Bryobacteraceae bacterium]HPQ17162.1 ornithine cyclodeaminase family protein [Bryobacteraceae bacterium]HPU72752.1 ornithine cyclodeaminase family protein [Bryobacteraceae bacterium]